MVQKKNENDANDHSDSHETNDKCIAFISDKQSLKEIELVNPKVQLGTILPKTLVESGCNWTLVHKSLANGIANTENRTYWILAPVVNDLKKFSKEIIKQIGVVRKV